MATIVEVTTKKPVVQDVTLKLNRNEASNLKEFISYWYAKNYNYAGTDYRNNDSVYTSLTKALDGKADSSVTKVAAF
jgi:hypothetical protein